MNLVSKTPKNNFWVENYTQKEKEFFISIGFEEKTHGQRTPFETSILDYTGSGLFGSWSKEENEKIFEETFKFTGKKSLIIETFNPYN
jgi:hypothetical protein